VAAVYNFGVDQGSTVRFSFTWKHNTGTADDPVFEPYDLTGCTARMQVRQARGKPLIFEVSTSTTDGSLAVQPGGVLGRIDVWLSDENTDLLDLKITKYDIEVAFPGGDVQRVLEGRITSNPSITKDES
jgi:hypothetical protein